MQAKKNPVDLFLDFESYAVDEEHIIASGKAESMDERNRNGAEGDLSLVLPFCSTYVARIVGEFKNIGLLETL